MKDFMNLEKFLEKRRDVAARGVSKDVGDEVLGSETSLTVSWVLEEFVMELSVKDALTGNNSQHRTEVQNGQLTKARSKGSSEVRISSLVRGTMPLRPFSKDSISPKV
jgi:hypothetical protein